MLISWKDIDYTITSQIVVCKLQQRKPYSKTEQRFNSTGQINILMCFFVANEVAGTVSIRKNTVMHNTGRQLKFTSLNAVQENHDHFQTENCQPKPTFIPSGVSVHPRVSTGDCRSSHRDRGQSPD